MGAEFKKPIISEMTWDEFCLVIVFHTGRAKRPFQFTILENYKCHFSKDRSLKQNFLSCKVRQIFPVSHEVCHTFLSKNLFF